MVGKPEPKHIKYTDETVDVSFTIPWDAGLNEFMDVFKGILKIATFSEYQVEEYLHNYESEILELYGRDK